ncbi:MAG: arginine--tRNA ligase [Burkholderiales bacterium]|nr:arginine--tRNA ligase [Burkholderiales bacterium]
MKTELTALMTAALRAVAPEAAATVQLERPKQVQHGDYACNLALQLAKPLKRNPREVAAQLVAALPASPYIEKAEIAGGGFVNLFLQPPAKREVLREIWSRGDAYGRSEVGAGRKVVVEFVSANPTGPLHVGHGRQAALGDAICSLLEASGWDVSREFYYNDAGAQINNLGLSVQARLRQRRGRDATVPDDGYHGEYVCEIADAYANAHPENGAGDNLAAITRFAVRALRNEQDRDLRAFGVIFDCYYLESSLYDDGKLEQTVNALQAAGKTYEQDDALWLKTTEFGDDKDRVMKKRDGSYTYFVPDVAYHVTKWRRGFTRAINVQGADHHSTVTRVRAGLQALDFGIPSGYPDSVLHQMVTVMRAGCEVKISKRAGGYVTLRDLIDDVGADATRFFFLLRKSDQHLEFDLDLAKSQSNDNPVYYVQYAHARICSVMREWGGDCMALAEADASPLNSEQEFALLRRLRDFSEVVEAGCRELSPHLVTFYLRELAAEFHSYYNSTHFLVDDEAVKLARLKLVAATGQIVKNGLALLGVSAPEKM